jgi:membrane protease YdiL (CAAX protease family)
MAIIISAAGVVKSQPLSGYGPDDPPWGVTTAALMFALSYYMPWLLYEIARGYFMLTGTKPSPSFVAGFSLSYLLVSHLTLLAISWLVITRAGKQPFFEAVGWGWPHQFELKKHKSDDTYSARRVTILACFALAGLSKYPVIFFPGPETDFEKGFFRSVAKTSMMTFVAVATAPLIEELVFRGILYPALRRLLLKHKLGRREIGSIRLRKLTQEGVSLAAVLAIAVVTGLFTLVHVEQYSSTGSPSWGMILSVALSGLFLTSLRAYTKSLLPSYVMHLILNASNIPLQILFMLGVLARR